MMTYMRFKLQRILRRNRRMAHRAWMVSKRYLHFNLFGKWRQFVMIRRFAIAWGLLLFFAAVGLVIQVRAIAGPALVLQPRAGGSYSEALVGTIKNINPILPEGSASADASHLIFSGLTRFNAQGRLEADLATGWDTSSDGKTYTFHLRHNVKWHDNVPFTAQDVVFTLTAIQNPDTRSPLSKGWQGVKATAPKDDTVVFTLPKPYTPFINATTVGILPRHLLESTEPSNLRVAPFNQHPVGTGPFKLDGLDQSNGDISFTANHDYFLGRPLIEGVHFRVYESAKAAFSAYTRRQVQGVARIRSSELKAAEALGTMKIEQATLPDQAALFLQTTTPILKDKNVRLALAEATNRQIIVRDTLGGDATALASPLLGQRFNLSGAPHQADFDLAKANARLESLGWVRGGNGIRIKEGKPLVLHLVTQSDTAYGAVAQELSRQWQRAGVRLDVAMYDASSLQQSYLRTRHYDVLLYGISQGADPDVYAYWDSSQAKDPGLNLSLYSSPPADKALEAGRVISDPALRSAKYRAFIQAFVSDTPAIMLYTPTYEYGVADSVQGIKLKHLITPSDRLTGIEKWSVRSRTVRRSNGS